MTIRGLVATALILRLFGVGPDILPGVGWLVLALAVLHVFAAVPLAGRRERWLGWIRAHAFELALALVCVAALGVRLPGFRADLGHTPLDIDEHRFASSVKHFFVTGELAHDTVEHYPGAVFWLFGAASFLGFLRGLTGGATTAASELPVEAFVEASRLANILVAGATVALTGLMARRLSGPAAGLIAAAVVAVAPLAVDVTVLVRNDPGMVLTVVATTWAALVYRDRGRAGWLAGAAVLAGVAAAIKYSAMFAVVPVLVAAATGTSKGKRLQAMLLGVFAFGLAAAVTNHFIWADFPNFLRQLSDQVAITGPGHWAATGNPAAFYTNTFIEMGAGWPMTLLAAAFTVYALSSRRPDLWIFVSFPLLYVWFMTGRPSQFPRWVYPMLPFVAVAGSSALMAVIYALAPRPGIWQPGGSTRVLQAATLLLVVAAIGQPVWRGAVSFSRRLVPTTQSIAEVWLREHASGRVVLSMRGWLDFDDPPFELRRVANLRAVLDGGVERLTGCDFVVVPEPYLGHSTLRQLGFVERFQAHRSFGGHRGFDFEIYAVPELPLTGECAGRGR